MNILTKLIEIFGNSKPRPSGGGLPPSVDTTTVTSREDALITIERLIQECQTLAETGKVTDQQVLFHLQCEVNLRLLQKILQGEYGNIGRDRLLAEARQNINNLLCEIETGRAAFAKALPIRKKILKTALECLSKA